MESNQIQPVTDFEYLRPPKEAYLHFPKGQNQFKGKEKKTIRFYFDGDSEYTEFEQQRLQKFKDYLKEKGALDILKGWKDQEIQRQLHGNYFDNKKTRIDIADTNEYNKQMEQQQIDDDIKKFLELDLIYVCGRDEKYRPIIVFNIYKLNPKEFPLEKVTKGVDYYYKKIMDYMFIPGQVENWVIIMDLNNAGLSSIPISMIKNIISYSSKYYKSRLHRLYMVNTTSSITTTWKAIKFFMDSQTVEKINILKEATPDKLFLHANKSQVPQTYGGTQTKSQNWPIAPQGEQGPFNVEGVNQTEDFISVEEYRSKVIREGVVCQELLK